MSNDFKAKKLYLFAYLFLVFFLFFTLIDSMANNRQQRIEYKISGVNLHLCNKQLFKLYASSLYTSRLGVALCIIYFSLQFVQAQYRNLFKFRFLEKNTLCPVQEKNEVPAGIFSRFSNPRLTLRLRMYHMYHYR